MILLSWIILIGGFLFINEVLQLKLGSPVRAISVSLTCAISGLIAWYEYKSKKQLKRDFRYAIPPLVISCIGFLYFISTLALQYIPTGVLVFLPMIILVLLIKALIKYMQKLNKYK
ncbi:MAG: hypothetical protein ABIE07_12375 [Candidatus Zixiibacteriota bacterium]